MAQIVKRNEPFVREVVSVEEAKEIFADQRFKLEHIDDLTEGEISVYRLMMDFPARRRIAWALLTGFPLRAASNSLRSCFFSCNALVLPL